MGASKKSPHQKCGDLYINMKSIKNKAKVFTFHCTLCSTACDQLKKFSQHLESHLEYFQNQFIGNNQLSLEPVEIKNEELTEQFNIDIKSDVNDCKLLVDNDDPLEMKVFKTELEVSQNYNTAEIGNEYGFLKKDKAEPINEDLDIVRALDESKLNKFNTDSLIFNDFSSDDSLELEYSSDSDFDLEQGLNSSKNIKQSGTKRNANRVKSRKNSTEKIEESHAEKSHFCKKSKKIKRLINASLLPFLIQQYKKYEILWEIDDIAFGIKIKKYEIFTKIAETLKVEKNEMISFEDLNYHINHLNELYTKDKEQELICKMEGKGTFMPEYQHYKEMSFLSKSQGPFLCSLCNKILPRYHSYCQHMAEHHKTHPYKCPACDSTYINYHKFLVHKKRHLGILDFHCKICGKGYMFKNDLEWHVTSHTGDKPYLCPICGTGFRARHGYDNHVRRHEKRFRHECHICKRGFNQLHALNSHVKSHLNIRDVICNICGKGFVHSKYLKRHEQIHGKEKHYKCNECGKAFFQSCGLRAHRKKHHSLLPDYSEKK